MPFALGDKIGPYQSTGLLGKHQGNPTSFPASFMCSRRRISFAIRSR